MWFGPSITGGDREFAIPDYVETTYKNPWIGEDGRRHVRVPGVHWFTNLDHKKRHEPLILFRRYADDPNAYPKYDNYDAIDVSKTADIPEDYFEHIGVPITFLDKYCPEQFEIVGATESEGKGFSNGLYIVSQRDAADDSGQAGLQTDLHTAEKIRIVRMPDGSGVIFPQAGVDLKDLAEQYVKDGFTYCNGVMGVPITFLDKYCPDQFELVWIASGHFKSTCPSEIMVLLGYLDLTSDSGTKGYGIVGGHQMYHRLFIRKLF